MLSKVREEAVAWCRGKVWYARLVFLAYFMYVLVRHLSDPLYNSILGGINLGVHELGHLVFAPFGEFLSVAGGTILQCLLPVAGVINFYVLKDFFSIALCFGWLSTNFFHVATYVSDARTMDLPLVGLPGDGEIIHDWNYLLSAIGLLRFDTVIAFLIRTLAVVSMLVCFGFGLWLTWQMYVYRRQGDTPVDSS